MKILAACSFDSAVLPSILADNIIYRPDLARKGKRFLSHALLLLQPDVLVVDELPDEDVLASWKIAMRSKNVSLVYLRKSDGDVKGEIAGVPIYICETLMSPEGEMQPFIIAENLNRVELASATTLYRVPQKKLRSVIIVGGGIVNLISAYYLSKSDYKVTILDASPDPRDSQHWSRYGCTRGGENARMFALSEADNYNDKIVQDADANSLFRRTVSECGWDIRADRDSELESKWIREYEIVTPWLAKVFNDDILKFNAEAGPFWYQLIEAEPRLFHNVELHHDIFRLYSDRVQFEQSLLRHAKLKSLRRAFIGDDVAEVCPALAEAYANHVIAGAMETVGFTLNIHNFVKNLIGYLEEHGVDCRYDEHIETISRNRFGEVTGLESRHRWIEADHYLMSLGAYGHELLRGTRSSNQVHGVLGAWLVIPNLEPRLNNSLKIARKGHITEDANVTVAKDAAGNDILIIGSGYGYTGVNPTNIDLDQLESMYRGVEDTARRFFPRGYEDAQNSGLLAQSRKYCVRPWTPTGLGIFEIMPAASGGYLIITGGHNTGGFTQAPAVAQAVLAAFEGRSHPMHQLYNPERLHSFYLNMGDPLQL